MSLATMRRRGAGRSSNEGSPGTVQTHGRVMEMQAAFFLVWQVGCQGTKARTVVFPKNYGFLFSCVSSSPRLEKILAALGYDSHFTSDRPLRAYRQQELAARVCQTLSCFAA